MMGLNAFFQVTKLEIRRVLRSYRFIVLLLACTLPMFLYLDLFARQQSVSIALQGETWFKIRSLQVFAFFAPFLSELVVILLVADLVGSEHRSSLMVLFSSSSPRLVILFGKFTAAVLLTGIGIFATSTVGGPDASSGFSTYRIHFCFICVVISSIYYTFYHFFSYFAGKRLCYRIFGANIPILCS
jgi:ABC-type transport system involved in multi-copper enzyme maturation permease subunit